MDAIRRAIVTSDWAELNAYGDINGALRRMAGLSTTVTGRQAITVGRT